MTPRIITAAKAQALLDGATPGPWRVWSDEGPIVLPTGQRVGGWTCSICRGDYASDSDHACVGYSVAKDEARADADARLLAAAPDLAHTVVAQAAEHASLRAIIDGLTTPPTDEEIRSAALAGLTVILHAIEACDGHRVDLRTRDALVLSTWAAHHADGNFASATWRLIDANDRPCAWPVVVEASR